VSTQEPDWFKQCFLDLGEDLAEARAAGKQGLMIVFHSEGCAYCKAFVDVSLRVPEIAARVRRHFGALYLDMLADAELADSRGDTMRVKDFAKREGAQFSPTVAFYDHDGRRLYRVTGYQSPERFREILDYVVGGHFRDGSLIEYRAKRSSPREANSLPSRIAQALTTLDLDRREPADRPLLVVFEKNDCDLCELYKREFVD